jgi:hypothetical protein
MTPTNAVITKKAKAKSKAEAKAKGTREYENLQVVVVSLFYTPSRPYWKAVSNDSA